MNNSQRNSMIDRIQKEYDREKIEGLPGPRPDVRAYLLIAEALIEIDRSLEFFVDEFKRDRANAENDEPA